MKTKGILKNSYVINSFKDDSSIDSSVHVEKKKTVFLFGFHYFCLPSKRKVSRKLFEAILQTSTGCFTATDMKKIDITHRWKVSEKNQIYHSGAYKLQFC